MSDQERTNPQERLLIVDDDEQLCFVMERAMRRRGYDVVVAHTHDQALAAAREAPPA